MILCASHLSFIPLEVSGLCSLADAQPNLTYLQDVDGFGLYLLVNKRP
jgi:hypothetical protein